VLGPSLSNTLGRRDGAPEAGLALVELLPALLPLLPVVAVVVSDMVLEFSTVTFRLILDILQDWAGKNTHTHTHRQTDTQCSEYIRQSI